MQGEHAVANRIITQIRSEGEIVAARQIGRKLAAEMGFSTIDATLIATAISEVARNILQYAKTGSIEIFPINNEHKNGITIIARDQGPGISNIALAMQDGYSTSGGLGLGLPGAKRLMSEFEITSEVGKGTLIIMKKWLE